jgi:hypothetical protein
MKTKLALLALTLAAPAAAQTPVNVGKFDALSLVGGGTVTVRHGPTHRVTLVRGDLGTSSVEVKKGGSLEIRACRRSCRDYRLEVEVVTPDLDAVAITGGGSIRFTGFPAQRSLAASVSGGGSLDTRGMAADSVAAAIKGGGTITAAPRRSLAASINGGGTVRYTGQPTRSVSINGGGSVLRVDK